MKIFVLVLDGILIVKNAPKLSAKYLEDKVWKTKEIQNIPVTLRTFLNQLKTFLEKLNTKEDSSEITISKVLSKIPDRKKTPKQQYNFSKAKIALEIHDM